MAATANNDIVRDNNILGVAPTTPTGTRSSSAQAQHTVGIMASPSTPQRQNNPYLKMGKHVTPENPYEKSASVLPSTPSSIFSRTTTSVRNPYLKKPTSTVAKRCLDFSAETTPPSKMKIQSSSRLPSVTEQNSNFASESGVAIDLSKEFSNYPAIDPRKTYTLYFDGGSRGNPGRAGAGMVLYDGKKEIWKGQEYIGDKVTNNVAEYTALVTGLDCARHLGVERIQAKGDSKLVVCQVLGEWNCNKPHLRQLLQQVVDVRQKFKCFDILHVRREDNRRADELANIAMDDEATRLDVIDSFRTPFSSQDQEGSNSLSQEETTQQEDFSSQAFSQSINDRDDNWTSELPFLCQFEIERFNLLRNSCLGDYRDRLKSVFEANKGKPSLTSELISFIYNEEEAHSVAPYDDFLKRCLNNGSPVDEAESCLFLFHAKLTTTGIELLPPEPADVFTRRIHRKYGSHRFLDLRCDEKCTESLVEYKKHHKKHFRDNKLELAGRKYGLLYSNPSSSTVIYRLFAESGVGIRKCDEISAPQVADRCIPSVLNPGLSLTKYMKRMKLNFTATVPSLILKPGMLEVIPDIKGDGDSENVMTDGCGLISREALNRVYSQYTQILEQRSKSLGNSNTISYSEASCPFSSFQGRIGGIKGMFVVDDSLNGVKVQCRSSQLKYHVPMTNQIESLRLDNDNTLYNTVEIKEWDKIPPHAHLSQNIIQLLEERGVPKQFFLSLAKKEIDELNAAREDYEQLMMKYNAKKYYQDSHCLFEDNVFMRMLHARVPLREPVMMCKINDFINDELKRYREKSKFPVIESMYLRMLPDHSGLLESNEVFVAVGDESAQYDVGRLGSLVAMRLPSYFLGDLRKFNNVVSKADLIQRCPEKGKFFSGIVAAIVLSTKGARSEADMMSGGDFDGDKAWCCWNEVIVNSVQEFPGQNVESPTTADPFKERKIVHANPKWTDLITIYTMHHRHDKKHLGTLVKILEMMRDNPGSMFDPDEIVEVAKKAHIQVDNPHKSQWTVADRLKYKYLRRPHWSAKRKDNSYQSNRVLGELFDMLDQAGGKDLNFLNIEDEMNVHIREQIELACEKDRDGVEEIRKDMRRHLSSFNNAMKDRIKSCDKENEVETRLKRKAISELYKQHRLEIENTYRDGDIPKVFSILYEQTYFQSRDRMYRWNKKPYQFAWTVGHDHLTRIIADGEAKKNGIGLAPTVTRGNDRLIFGKRR